MRFARLIGVTLATTALTAGTAVPAAADTTSTTVTFVVASGDLSITAPDAADLGSADPGDAASGQLGETIVEDNRALADASWTATASLEDPFTMGEEDAEVIPAGNVSYAPGEPIQQVNGPFTAGEEDTLEEPVTAFSRGEGPGNNLASWNPTLTVQVPDEAVAGSYSGTVTHSVA